MSERGGPPNDVQDDPPDPVDAAYVRAEALLNDGHARLARRERVLAAVARQPTATFAQPADVPRRSAWSRRGPRWVPWLAAACVVGLALLIVPGLYQPPQRPPPPAKVAVRQAAPAVLTSASSPKPAEQRMVPEVTGPPVPLALSKSVAPRADLSAQPIAAQAAVPHPPAPAPPLVSARAEAAPRLAVSPAAPPSTVGSLAGSREQGFVGGFPAQATAGASDEKAVVRSGAALAAKTFTAPPAIGGLTLLTAAAAGDTAEVRALLDEGVPVDSPNANGDTPLMEAIQSDQPTTAALLIRRGASLDRRNRASESARDMATAKNDPSLNRALGMVP